MTATSELFEVYPGTFMPGTLMLVVVIPIPPL
jgi:hypothetical protein